MILIGLLFSILGLAISCYIHKKVLRASPLMCPRNAPCEKVVNSAYGATLGVRNTVLGILYYAAMIALFAALLLHISFPLQVPLMMALSFGAFLFSMYLIYLQGYVLRNWCLWCLGSAIAATAIAKIVLILGIQILR